MIKPKIVWLKEAKPCGECQACCVLYELPYLQKPRHSRCLHQCEKGCAIHDQERHPTCTDFYCVWAITNMPEEMRPDRCGAIIRCEGAIVKNQHGYAINGVYNRYPLSPKCWRVATLSESVFRGSNNALEAFIQREKHEGIVLVTWSGKGATPTTIYDHLTPIGGLLEQARYETDTPIPLSAVFRWMRPGIEEYWERVA